MAHRMDQLDVLRGVLALIVVFHHAILSLPENDAFAIYVKTQPIFGVLAMGRPLVICFFVLSGFVLTWSLLHARMTMKAYVIRRIFRLAPPLWAAVTTSFVMAMAAPNSVASSMSAWFNEHWGDGVSKADFVRNLLMQATEKGYPGDHVIWSLVHELRLSLAMPVLVMLMTRLGVAHMLGVCAAVSILSQLYIDSNPLQFRPQYFGFYFDNPELSSSLALTARFLICFALGASLAIFFENQSKYLRVSPVLSFSLSSAGFLVLNSPHEAVMTIGSGAVVFATAITTARWLVLPPLFWIGRVSFSLYLNHLPTLLFLGIALDGIMSPRAIIAVSLVVSLILAEVMFVMVERPSIAVGRTVSRALDRYFARPTSS